MNKTLAPGTTTHYRVLVAPFPSLESPVPTPHRRTVYLIGRVLPGRIVVLWRVP